MMTDSKEQTTISVVIPAYNTAVTLDRCLRSILSQTLRPRQIIIVNDGSTDNTAEIAKTYQPGTIYVEQWNQGASAARNAGLEIASGELVAFLDADDYWMPTFLELCAQFLAMHPEVIAVSTGQKVVDWRGNEAILPRMAARTDASVLEPIILEDFFSFWAEHDHVRTGSVVIRRRTIQEAGFQRADLRTGEDLEYWGYLATFGHWGFIPKVLLVIDGTAATAAQGWVEKHKTRWALAPDIFLWEKRIVPRLQSRDWSGFHVVRGRLAQGYAHDSVLAGYDDRALLMVRTYGDAFPKGYVSAMMLVGARAGYIGWKAMCHLLRLREQLKDFIIRSRKLCKF